ncbi:D-2-hydroxyacid dehydrogenase family protein [Nocardioides sp. SR21]|uniref:D-2-hydroxyacid dehydrogenase family protein n=1 Tax=Nocardioides sp. SR21 TaxID=2919501 RepID=UPI001FAA9A57|nr:D-2-hydroxyacid dehydrogenase family protein [Nocardioides sp. SR21]
MTTTCVLLDDYQGVATTFADWSALDDVELTSVRTHLLDEDAVVTAAADAEVVVLMRERTPFPASLLARLPHLRLLITTGMRNASVDVAAATRLGVTVCGTPSSSTPPAELTWALILGLVRNLVPESNALRSGGPWQSTVGRDLAGATLGVVGLGKIGSRVATIGQAFGMDVVAWSTNLTAERAADAGVRRADRLPDLLAQSDIVTLHLVLSDRTHGLLGADEIALMRRTAYLVNTSRAGIVDTPALAAALTQNRIAGAGLDVYDEEPLRADDQLRTLPNVLCTPHLGYVTENNYRAYFTGVVEDITAWQSGQPIRRLS